MSSSSSQPRKDTVTMAEVLENQAQLEEQAAELLPFDISQCSKSLGQIRQAVYSCLTCNPCQEPDHTQAGVCSSCSVSCHTDHHLVELFVRRNFVCECGTARCNLNQCCLDHSSNYNASIPPVSSSLLINKYDHNFDGQFCICERGKHYDPETETEDMYQCLACEDWRHAGCLGPHPNLDEWDDFICANCVQNDPVISLIIFKYAGGDNTGMIVCTSSDEPDKPTCYGKLVSNHKGMGPANLDFLEQESISTDHQVRSGSTNPKQMVLNMAHDCRKSIIQASSNKPMVQDCTLSHLNLESNTSIFPVEKPINNPLKLCDDLHVNSHQEIFTDTSSQAKTEYQTEEMNLLRGEAESMLNSLNEKQKKKHNLAASTKKRSLSPLLGPDDSNQGLPTQAEETGRHKKMKITLASPSILRLKSVDTDDHHQSEHLQCKAPFNNQSESILNSLDPKFTNVYLTEGWRDRWCKCHECYGILSRHNWLIEPEEDAWEPLEDHDALKSIHELGLEALKSLPHDKLIDGLTAFNKLKEELSKFLRPFEVRNQLVTEHDIQQFFQTTKDQIQNHSWL